ncbi:MAG: hypothetical protein U5N86_11440 [Planctomycetota bacterium]|nr:hypothetical protein [Planctomycetota bacterium]
MTANDKGNLNSDFRPGVPGDAKDFEGVRDFEEKIHPPLIPNKQQNVDGVPERTSFETATDAQRPVAAPELPTAERTHGSTVTEKLEGFDPVRGRGLTRQEILEIQIQPLLGERTEENTSKLLNTSSSTMAWVAKGDGWYVWEPEGTEPEEFPPGLVPQEEEWTWKGNVTVDSPDVKPKKGKRYKFRPKSTGGVKGHRYLDSAEIIRLYNGWYSSRVRETTETCGSACIKNAV